MDYQSLFNYNTNLPLFGMAGSATIIIVLLLWELAWKGYALWKAGRNNEPGWFVALMVLNTIGILPILYIFVFAKDRKKK